jgi:hypothetical protein
MKTIFDFRKFWLTKHDKTQLAVFDNIEFIPIQGHTHLFVADVSEQEKTLLVLLGLNIDHSIATEMQHIESGSSVRMLYKSGDNYTIIERHHATLPHTKS